METETKSSVKQKLDWLPILTDENIQRLCQNPSSKLLSRLQRQFLPVFLQVNEDNEFYPLLANVSGMCAPFRQRHFSWTAFSC